MGMNHLTTGLGALLGSAIYNAVKIITAAAGMNVHFTVLHGVRHRVWSHYPPPPPEYASVGSRSRPFTMRLASIFIISYHIVVGMTLNHQV